MKRRSGKKKEKKIKGEKERNGLTIMRSEGSETEKLREKKH